MKTLFRNDDCYGGRVTDARKVLRYEIKELFNVDVIDYCRTTYSLTTDLKKRLSEDMHALECIGEWPETIDQDIETLLQELSGIFKEKITHVLWLAERWAVEEYYYGTEENIKEFETSKIILSDLGDDGILFGYPEKPQPVET